MNLIFRGSLKCPFLPVYGIVRGESTFLQPRFNPMKTFTRLLFCFFFLSVGKAAAQETFAPLISENCVAFVHVDFRKVELDNVKAFLQKTGEDLITTLGFDGQSFNATSRELAVELEKLDLLVRPTFETITKELGIRELAIIVDMSLLEQGLPPLIAVPWKNKTDKDIETFFTALAVTWGGEPPADLEATNFVRVEDFLLLVPGMWGQRELVTDWAKQIVPVTESPIFDALQSVAGAEVKFTVAMTEPVRTMIRSAPLPPDVPAEVRNFLLFAAPRIDWASASVSLADILGTEKPENTGVLMTVKMARPTDARMIHGMLENLIEFGVNAGRFAMEMQDAEFQIPPLAWQFAKGFLRTLLPDVEGDKLIFRIKANVGGSTQVVLGTAGVAAALLIPAVQAAREAARRAQCSNNIKQIMLAIHNYHDTHGTLPPLYTVDANGKPLHSWRVLILPYLEQTAVYNGIRLDEPWNSPHNQAFHHVRIPAYDCRSNPSGGCCYSAIAGEGLAPNTRANSRGEHTFARITDGTSNTIAIVEVREPFPWMDPTADIDLAELLKGINAPEGRTGGFHPAGMNVGFFDGVVRFIPQTIDLQVLRALATPAGGENVSL